MTLSDFNVTPPHVVFGEIARLAAEAGVAVAESELIGLIPRKAVEMGFAHYMKLPGFHSELTIENAVAARAASK
jgi:glutamate formiminotransferase